MTFIFRDSDRKIVCASYSAFLEIRKEYFEELPVGGWRRV